jgi:Mg-chelatase subunit ChlD
MSDENPELQPWIDPELEARVVAWVLGEASPFEAAELERIIAEKPELGIFKRRIEAVHGLVAAASRLELDPMRLSEERRSNLLRMMGSAEAAGKRVVAIPSEQPTDKWRIPWITIAACLLIVTLLASISVPAFTGVQIRAAATKKLAEEKMAELAKQQADIDTVQPGAVAGNIVAAQPAQMAQAVTAQQARLAALESLKTIARALPVEQGLTQMQSEPDASTSPADQSFGISPPSTPGKDQTQSDLPELYAYATTIAGPSGKIVRENFAEAGGGAPVAAAGKDATVAGENTYTGATTISGGAKLKLESHGTEDEQSNEPDSVARKLDRIIIPKIEMRDATVSDAVDFLKEKSRELDRQEPDPARRGVNIALPMDPNAAAAPASPAIPGLEEPNAAAAPASPAIPGLEPAASAPAAPGAGNGNAKITLSLNNVPLGEALKYVAEISNLKLKVGSDGVSMQPPSVNTDELVTKEYKVPSGFMSAAPVDAAPVAIPSSDPIWANSGVEFPPGTSAVFIPATSTLIVHNVAANIALTDAVIEKLNRKQPTPPPADEVSAADQAYSTFSLHVSDVSFLLARASLAAGVMPDPDSVRPEEFYNAFDYGDPAPGPGEKIACRIEQAAHPMLQQRNLVRIAMKVASSGRGAGQPLRLTVLLDTSGSMEREDRAASVQRAMEVLTKLLGPGDAVTLIGFARQPRLLAEEVPGDQAGKLVDIVKHTPPEGGTNMEEALKLASELALRHFEKGGQNRVVMLTDGAANLGDADPDRLAKLVEQLRRQGVSFDACGVGADGLNDDILEALTRKGGGRYYFLNKPEDADEGFARQLAGAFRPAAENVKMQVRFNPERVGKYLLIGFEKHRLNQEDFRNDKVTAAQLAAEEAAVALYQVQVLPEGDGEIGEVFVRFRDPADGRIIEQSWTIPYDAQTPALDKAAPSIQLAATAALLAEKLHGGPAADSLDLDTLAPIVAQLRGKYAGEQRVRDLVAMYEEVRRMTGEK